MLSVCQRSTILCTIYNTYRQWHPCARPSRVVPADGWERFRRYRRDSSCLTSRSRFYVVEWKRNWKRKTEQTETNELEKKIETHKKNTDCVHKEERAQRVAWRIPMTDDVVVVQVKTYPFKIDMPYKISMYRIVADATMAATNKQAPPTNMVFRRPYVSNNHGPTRRHPTIAPTTAHNSYRYTNEASFRQTWAASIGCACCPSSSRRLSSKSSTSTTSTTSSILLLVTFVSHDKSK